MTWSTNPNDAYDASISDNTNRRRRGGRKRKPWHRRACKCLEPAPVMQADGKFYCYTCSFETGARPKP